MYEFNGASVLRLYVVHVYIDNVVYVLLRVECGVFFFFKQKTAYEI